MIKVDKELRDTKGIIFRLLCFFEGLFSSWITAPHKSMDAKMIRLICNNTPLFVFMNFTIYITRMSIERTSLLKLLRDSVNYYVD